MTTTAFDDQFVTGKATAQLRKPYDTVAILRRNIAALEVALRQQTELKEKAEAELAKLREQKPVAWRHENGNIFLPWQKDLIVTGAVFSPLFAAPVPAPHPGATHCDDCGLTWLDDGLNPLWCPYCKESVPAPAVPAVVFVAHNKTSSILFAARKDAEQYVAGFGPAAGVLVTECAVIGSQSSTQAPAVPDPELVAAVTYYLKADDDLKEATRRTGFGGMGNPTASVKERYRVGAIRHAARKKLDTLLQSAPQAPAVPKEWRRAVSEFLSSHDAAWAELFKSLPADTRSVTVSNHQADAVRKANDLRALLQSAEVRHD